LSVDNFKSKSRLFWNSSSYLTSTYISIFAAVTLFFKLYFLVDILLMCPCSSPPCESWEQLLVSDHYEDMEWLDISEPNDFDDIDSSLFRSIS